MYIETQQELEAFVERARASSLLGIDTEFLRERTYFPKLCLVQLATEDEVALVDPLALSDLSPLSELFEAPSITKIFHAGAQDLEILEHEVGVLPKPIFDTQIAAAFLGYAYQMGYGSLVLSVCGVSLKKGDSYTDWAHRPLSQSQLAYAADDVLYLPQLYKTMKESLVQSGRFHWLDDEFAPLLDPARYEQDPWQRYKRLKRASSLSRRQLSAAREVSAWREIQAQQRDIPRKWVLSDEQIIEACRRESASVSELYMIRGMRERLAVAEARNVVNLIACGLNAPEESWPALERTSSSEPNVEVALDLMNALVHVRAREHGVAVQLLATHDELAALARGHYESLRLLEGWRRDLVGDDLMALLEGRLTLSLDKLKLAVAPSLEKDEVGKEAFDD